MQFVCAFGCVPMATIRDALLGARTRLIPGWSESEERELGLSLDQALTLATVDDDVKFAAWCFFGDDVGVSLAEWLDAPERSHAEVLSRLSRAAQRAQLLTQ